MQAKVKLTDAQGQEYLLLVTKINLKGILVGYIPHLDVDAPVRLELQIGAQHPPLALQGAIHKNVTHASGSKGTIVRFVALSEAHKARLSQLLTSRIHTSESAQENSQSKTQILRAPSSEVLASSLSKKQSSRQEQTLIADADTFSHLLLQSPDRGADFVTSTMDEESLSSPSEGLAGKTIIAPSIPDYVLKPPARKKRSWKTALLLLALGFLAARFWGPMGRFLDQRFGKTSLPPIPSASPSEELENQPAAAEPDGGSASSMDTDEPSTTTPPPVSPGHLSDVKVTPSTTALSVEFIGSGDFSKVNVEESQSPKRLMLTFDALSELRMEQSTVQVGKTPLLRVRARTTDDAKVTVLLDLYPVDFPTYTLEPSPAGLKLTLNRQ